MLRFCRAGSSSRERVRPGKTSGAPRILVAIAAGKSSVSAGHWHFVNRTDAMRKIKYSVAALSLLQHCIFLTAKLRAA